MNGLRPPSIRTPPANGLNGRHHGVAGGARARDAEAFKGGMTVGDAAFDARAGELKKPAKRVALIDMGLLHLFMM